MQIIEPTTQDHALPGVALSPPQKDDQWKRFAFIIAHDLKEPIRNVSSCSRLLASKLEVTDPEVQQIAGWLMDSADKLQDLIDALFDLARHGSEAMEQVDLGATVGDIERDFRCLIQRSGGTLEVAELPTVYAGPLGMRIVFGNLIENALKYAQPGIPPRMKISAEKREEGWCMKVQDNGQGMSPKEVKHAFDPFRRFSDQADGLGMGLAHVFKIVDGHGGTIQIDSTPGSGTTFSVLIPN